MAPNPSGQDTSQMEALTANLTGEEGAENRFFVRCITNKKGDYNFAIFQYDLGIALTGADWKIETEHSDERTTYWEDQITDKVSELKPVQRSYNYGKGKNVGGYNGWQDGCNGFEDYGDGGYNYYEGYRYNAGKANRSAHNQQPSRVRKQGNFAFEGQGKGKGAAKK